MLDYRSEPVVDDGGMVWAAAVSTCTAANGCSAPGGTGAEATDQQGFAVHQVAGPSLRPRAQIEAEAQGQAQPATALLALPDTATAGTAPESAAAAAAAGAALAIIIC